MRSLATVFNFGYTSKPYFDATTLVIVFGIIIAILIAVYAIMVNPNDATAAIGFPP